MVHYNGTSGNDNYVGTTGSDHINGGDGNDTLNGNGNPDYQNDDHIYGGNGNDRIIINGRGGGAWGGTGDDIIESAKLGYGQFHFWGDTGNDRIVMSLANNVGWGTQAYHAYGGEGADRFEFNGVGTTNEYYFSRIDDFDASRDSIVVDGQVLNLNALPSNMRVVNFVGQQFLLIGNNVVIALEGARLAVEFSGYGTSQAEEAHFWSKAGDPANGVPAFPTEIFSQAAVAFVDQVNFVPWASYSTVNASLNRINGNGTINSGATNDYIWAWNASTTSDSISSGAGNDVIDANTGRDTVYGGDGNDLIAGGIDRDTLYGDAGNDQLWGGSQNDFLYGGTGRDALNGGTSNDRLQGGADHDSLSGDDGNDSLYGEDGNDNLGGQNGNDLLYGGLGNDTMWGDADEDSLYGDDGNDQMHGQTGNDRVYGGLGNDIVNGNDGNDRVYGDSGNDNIGGQNGNDLAYGGSGQDILTGGSGNDSLYGGAERDQVTGNSGNDVFVFQAGDMISWNNLTAAERENSASYDLITDFVIGQDKINFSGVAGATQVSDFTIWKHTEGTNVFFFMDIKSTHERVLVDVADTVTWSQFAVASNFIFN